jgi:heptosyltransferase-3
MLQIGDQRILVIVMRRLGDVLLTTPLIRTLRQGFPRSTIDVLVFQGTEGILAGNPDVAQVLTFPERPSPREFLAEIRRLWRRYDLAVATQSGDRPIFFAYAAGRKRIGFVGAEDSGAWWKRRALNVTIASDPDNHRVLELLRLGEAIGLSRRAELVCPAGQTQSPAVPFDRYAVLHPAPMYQFRRWNDDGWRELARSLAQRRLAVVITGGPGEEERSYLDRLWPADDATIHRLDGRLDWPQLAALISRAAVYVGPDTSMTHLAAGTGCPTVAIYGPASPRRIGPWPVGAFEQPWTPAGHVQHTGNVWVVQNPLPCLPCEKLGCENHYKSYSQCLDELSAQQVLRAVDEALNEAKIAV